MVHRRLPLLLLIVTALWLPLQSVAALVAACGHGLARGAARPLVLAQATSGCQEDHQGHHRQATAASSSAQGGLSCDQCGFCHLAGAGMAVSLAVARPPVPAADPNVSWPVRFPPDHLPEPQSPPPRSS